MKPAALVERLEKLYGYDLKGHPAVEREAKSTLRLGATDADEYLDDLTFANVHWCGESQPGDDPFEGEEQPATVLARHLCGLFVLRSGIPYGCSSMMGDWLLDLNPRSDDLTSPLYFQVENEEQMIGWWLLETADALDESHDLFGRVQAAHQAVADGATPSKLSNLADEMRHRYPRVCATFRDWFANFGIESTESGRFKDVGGERLIGAYRGMLPIARVLIARRADNEDAMLDLKDVKDALTLAEDEGDYPPALMLRLLAPALSESGSDKRLAKEIMDGTRGVALTRRWADLVAKNAGPFGS